VLEFYVVYSLPLEFIWIVAPSTSLGYVMLKDFLRWLSLVHIQRDFSILHVSHLVYASPFIETIWRVVVYWYNFL